MERVPFIVIDPEADFDKEQGSFTVLDLFCGAGGLSLGFVQARFQPVLAVDNNGAALHTHTRNLAGRAVALDLSREDDLDAKLPPATVVTGGPPCQGFSSAGSRRTADARNSLVGCFARVVARLRPAAFVFENVEGFLTAEDGWRVMELLHPLIVAGYHVHLRKINAANYGVPQHRKRVLAIGGLGWSPSFPTATHSAYGAPGAGLASRHLPLTPTITQALYGLAPATTEPPGEPQGHFYRPLSGLDLDRATALKPGQTMRDLPEALQHESYRRRAFRRVLDGTPSERRGGPPAGVRRLHPDEPAKAITGSARSEFLHPSENRPLTIRECARLQTFPDDFSFCGNPSEQAQLIGNAVPPLLARTIALSLAHDLKDNPTAPGGSEHGTREHGRGTLLSFVPTLSDGFSPILRRVTERIRAEFPLAQCAPELTLWP